MPYLALPRHQQPSSYVALDGNTQRNLELTATLNDKSKRGSLLGVLDKTMTGMGERMLRQWILHPLAEVAPIGARLDAVTEFFDNITLRMEVRDLLKGMPDVERLLGRITASAGNARDVRALGAALTPLPALLDAITTTQAALLQALLREMDPLEDITGAIDATRIAVLRGRLRVGGAADPSGVTVSVLGGPEYGFTLSRENGKYDLVVNGGARADPELLQTGLSAGAAARCGSHPGLCILQGGSADSVGSERECH